MGLVILVAVSAGCGESPGETQDYGPYPARRVDGDYDRAPSAARGILVESLRLGEHMVSPTSVDPELSAGRGGGVLLDFQGLADSQISPQKTVLGHYTLLGGFETRAANRAYLDKNTPGKSLSVEVFAFPDEQTAIVAAADLEHADFADKTDNAPVAIDSVPGSLSHWRPGVPMLSSWLAWKTLVIRVVAERPDPDLGELTDRVARAFGQQQIALASFTATRLPDLARLSLDPDNLLPRLVKTGEYQPDATKFAVYGPRAYAVLSTSPAADTAEYDERGVTAIAVSYNKHLFRARDPASATELARWLTDRDSASRYRSLPGVTGRSGITCSQATAPDPLVTEPRRYRCLVVRDALVAVVYGNTGTEVRQLAAAQYAVMADPK
ncbi:DUF7373 family lipoprotein [Nocardia concava]|uniref:DUF7373 family lipoprotein n=1 Tax=Nocardia concava TaxID=257281 RepID=UPI0012F7F8CE|nr:hypothetical protein [Nocardia concava]